MNRTETFEKIIEDIGESNLNMLADAQLLSVMLVLCDELHDCDLQDKLKALISDTANEFREGGIDGEQ